MQLTDLAVIKQLNHWLQAGQSVWLCSIVATYGSAPRPVGSLFAFNGVEQAGSISGGCLEQAFIETLARGDFHKDAQLFDYNSQLNSSGQASELPCGGSIQLLVEVLHADKETLNHAQQWLDMAQSFTAFERIINIERGERELKMLADNPHSDVDIATSTVTLRYAQVWSILLLGISQVSEHVARMGLMAGYQVRICDNREEMSSAWTFDAAAGGIDVQWCDPGAFIAEHATPRSAVLALGHDPRVDDIGLMTAFDKPGFYLGAMGSMATTRKRRERMQRICQFDDAILDRLHAPIGLDIGSKTPVEIGISIMAALTLHKSQAVVA